MTATGVMAGGGAGGLLYSGLDSGTRRLYDGRGWDGFGHDMWQGTQMGVLFAGGFKFGGATLRLAGRGLRGIRNWAKPSGTLKIKDWTGYPEGIPRPKGQFRLIDGDEYDAARKAANNANRALHRTNPTYDGLELHEIHPVI